MSESRSKPDSNPTEDYHQAGSQQSEQTTRSKADHALIPTIKTLAQEIRARACSYYGEKAFAQMCLAFEANIIPDQLTDAAELSGLEDEEDDFSRQKIGLLRMLAQIAPIHKDGPFWQLALVWLDARGWGELSLQALNLRVQLLKDSKL